MRYVRSRLSWMPLLALAACVAAATHVDYGDNMWFLGPGKTLLSAHWASVYADPGVQAGPIHLALYGAAFRLAGSREGALQLLSYVLGIGALALLLVSVRRVLAGGARVPVEVLVGLLAIGSTFTWSAFAFGHPADVFVPLAWVLAAVEARKGRVALAGLIIGLSAGVEVWGVLGGAVLVLAPRVRSVVHGLAVEATAVACLFAPFVLFGSFRMFQLRWDVTSHTLVSLFVPVGSPFPWPLRFVQAAAAVGAGALVAHGLRRSAHALWLAPLTIVAVRLILDPLDSGYYFLGIEGPGLVGLAVFVTSERFAPVRATWAQRLRVTAAA